MFILGVLVLIIVACTEYTEKKQYRLENYELKKKIKILEEKLKKYEEQGITTDVSNITNIETNSKEVKSEDVRLDNIIEKVRENNTTVVNKPVESQNTAKEVKPQKTKEQIRQEELERKNTMILATGAILIVLAAIVFLASTWSLLSNVVKAISLFLFIVVFLGASKISKEKYNLENTSKTFFYIAMAYIPIFLLSISFFSILGKYLSIYGEGKYIYLTLAFIITSMVYLYFYKKQNDIILFYGCIISQITSLIMFALIFSNRLDFIVLLLLIYSTGLIIFNKIKESEFIEGLIILIEIIGIIFGVVNFFISTMYILGIYILIALNSIMMSFNSKDKDALIMYNNIFNVFLYVIGFYISFVFFESLDNYFQILVMLVYSISIYTVVTAFFEVAGKEKINYIEVINLIAIGVLYFVSIVVKSSVIKPYMIAIVEEIFLIIELIRSKDYLKEIYGFLIPITLIVIFVGFLSNYNARPELYFVMAIVYFVISELIRQNKENIMDLIFFAMSNMLLPITFLYNLAIAENGLKFLILYKLVFLIVYSFYFVRTKNHIFKYLVYIVLGYICIIDYKIEAIGHLGILAPMFLSFIVILLEEYINKLKDDFSEAFIFILEMISYVLLIAVDIKSRIIIAFLYTIIIYVHALITKNKPIIPVVGLGIILILTNEVTNIQNMWKVVYIILLSVLSFNKRKVSVETLLSGIMLFSFLNSYEINSLTIKAIIFMTWSLYNFAFSKNEKERDLFKFMVYISGLFVYCSLIDETKVLADYRSVYFMGVTVCAILITRTILNKYMDKDELDGIEYVAFSIIYLAAIMYYLDELDGMIFVVFLALVTGFSYYLRDGKIFITSIGAIIVNIFLLSREFWFIIPWWIYLMGLGTALITFAITNEKRANKKKIDNRNFIKKLKDKIESD